jgi:hypothetical protein
MANDFPIGNRLNFLWLSIDLIGVRAFERARFRIRWLREGLYSRVGSDSNGPD